MAGAACRGLTPLFFPDRGDTDGMNYARAVCNDCPVWSECLDWSMTPDAPRDGVIAGFTPRNVSSSATTSSHHRHARVDSPGDGGACGGRCSTSPPNHRTRGPAPSCSRSEPQPTASRSAAPDDEAARPPRWDDLDALHLVPVAAASGQSGSTPRLPELPGRRPPPARRPDVARQVRRPQDAAPRPVDMTVLPERRHMIRRVRSRLAADMARPAPAEQPEPPGSAGRSGRRPAASFGPEHRLSGGRGR